MTRGSSVSSLKSGKASIQYPPPKTKCNPHQQENSNDATSDVASTTAAAPPPPDVTPTIATITNTAAASLSESVQPKSSTDTQQPPSSQHPRISTSSPEPMNKINHDETNNNNNNVIPNDDEIIAEIIAKATAVSKASGQYSSLSSGRASIAKTRSSDSSPPPIMTQSLSESSSRPASIRSIDNHRSSTSHPRNSMSSSIFSKLVTGGSNKKKPIKDDEKARQELAEAGIEVKEIKSTLGRMVVPDDVVNPMPKITLEKPQYARVNR